MSENAKDGASTRGGRKCITLERFYRADIQDIWDLWTTKEGIVMGWNMELDKADKLVAARTAGQS